MPTTWPKEVTMVTAVDICRSTLTDGEKHCALGWRQADGIHMWDKEQHFWKLEFIKQAELLGAVDVLSVARTNDNCKNSLSLIARAINRTWAALGYVINNPECTRAGKLRKI